MDPQIMSGSSSRELLEVEPELIHFPAEPNNESISWIVYLTNKTDEHVVFMLMDKSSPTLAKLPLYGTVPSRSSYNLIVSATKEELATAGETCFDLILQSSTYGDKNLECAEYFQYAKEMANDVHEVAVSLKTDFHALQLGETKSKPDVTLPNIKMISMKNIDEALLCLDVHPTEQWIVTGHANGNICTWNHETQALMYTYSVSTERVTSVKVVARKEWIVALTNDSFVYVCKCLSGTTVEVENAFASYRIVMSLDVSPTMPYLLLGSGELLHWDHLDTPVECLFDESNRGRVAFNPKNSNSFACASQEAVKVWNRLHSHESYYTLSGHLKTVTCLHYFQHDDGQYLITGSDDCTAKIWNLRKRKCIHTMVAIFSPVTCVISLPGRPYLVTGSEHGTIQLWSSSDFRLLRTINYGGGGPIMNLACLHSSPRVVIGQEKAIAVLEIIDEEIHGRVANEGNNKRLSVQETPGLSWKKNEATDKWTKGDGLVSVGAEIAKDVKPHLVVTQKGN